MRNLYLTFALLMPLGLAAQGEFPYGYWQPDGFQDHLPLLELPTLDHAKLLAEDTQIEEEGGRTNNGRIIPTSISPDNSGTWTDLPDGGRTWQLRFRTADAQGVSVFFDDFFLPQGAHLYIYNTSRTMLEGPWDATENDSHGIFATLEVVGDEAILEYDEPYGVVESPRLGIRGFGHYYRYVYNYTQPEERAGGSEACEVDVNCPEGGPWQAERNAVVRLQIVEGQFLGLCSASLVNNFRKDCTNYILCALHCALNSTADDLASSQARFNFEKSGCGGGSTTSTHNKTGLLHICDSDDGGGESGSDFILFELENDINDNFNPYYAGFDASGDGSASGVSIHHPAGDVKKISSYTDNLTSVWLGSPGSHWEVNWVETETSWGVTEGGSSGSPLFNSNHKIIGTLTGGGSFCNNPDEPDYYGKVSKHWDGNAQPANQKLKFWLDPDNTGQEVLYGAWPDFSLDEPCGVEFVGQRPELKFNDVQVFPSLGADVITIECSEYDRIQEVQLVSGTGALIETFRLNRERTEKDLSALSSGVYFLTFRTADGQFVTKKITRM